MVGGLDDNALLNSVAFYTITEENRFDVTIFSKGMNEKIASGILDQLVFHLPGLTNSKPRGKNECFKLELTTELEDFSWFTKATLSRFLCLVSAPEFVKSASSIENEISQLEDARKFHLALYAKDHAKASEDEPIEIGNSEGEILRPRVQSDASSDPTKNELLRAMDVRLSALKEELSASFGRALGSVPAADHISDLRSFCDYFGALTIRDILVKYLEPLPNGENMTISENKNGTRLSSNDEKLVMARESATLAKMAQAERQISSESEDSDSAEAEKHSTERSRSLIRGPSPRRSASPMRRVQIGRSGTRKPAALSIRSLTYFPSREKPPLKDTTTDGNSSCNEDPDQASNRSESAARRMSVQDAINLFESKQRDQSSAAHSRRPSGEVSFVPNKPVLRRWSSGICETSREELQSVALTVEEVKTESENPSNDMGLTRTDMSEVAPEKTSEASEWSRQKEAELNQMLMNFMETKKPSKYGTTAAPSSQKRGDQTKQPKEKISASRKPPEKAITPVKTPQPKAVSRAEPLAQTQKPRRNSSPPVLSKKDAPKATVSKKPAPLTRSSLPQSPSSRTVGTPRQSQTTALSPSAPVPKTERTPTSSKSGKLALNEGKKASPRTIEDRKPGAAVKAAKSKVLSRPSNEASAVSAKPRAHNKAPKKSTIVPLESKSSKKVNSPANPGAKPEESKSKDSPKVSAAIEVGESTSTPHGNDPEDQEVTKLDNDLSLFMTESVEVATPAEVDATQGDEVKVISSAAWEEVDQDKVHESDGCSSRQMDGSDAAPAASSSSSRMRYSLSQMLLAESSEPEVLEWGNAENPPALVYQKDAPKGLKKLLKFGRKTKGEVNLSDLSSPSVLSDGEEEKLEVKVNGKKGSVAGKVKIMPPENRSVDFPNTAEVLSAQLGDQTSLREGQSNKVGRSFFSLSSFRSRKTGSTSSR
ncbi:uncharacterized protein LOC144707643 [Wolffia australiana]